LQYSAYNKLALRTMMEIARDVRAKHSLQGFAMVHRLGTVPIGEESILIAVSAPHRQAAWCAGEEALEKCKARVEVWKREEFEGEEGVWRANRDGVAGQRIVDPDLEPDSELDAAPQPEAPPKVLGAALELLDYHSAMGPVVRLRRLGESGHGAVVNPRPPSTDPGA
jgi:molybdopterin synthase catalytic subunit